MALVAPTHLDEVLAIAASWDVPASVCGEVVTGDRLRLTRGGELVADAPARSLADEGPTYHRPMQRPAWLDDLQAQDVEDPQVDDLEGAAWALLRSPNIGRPDWVTRQYDHLVGAGTVLGPGEGDAGVVRLPGSRRGVAVSHRRQRPLVRARPARGHPPGAGRGLPQRRLHGRAARGHDQLPQLRQPRAARGDVAVRRGRRRARRGRRGAGRPSHRRQRQPLQRDPGDARGRPGRDPADAGARRARAARRRGAVPWALASTRPATSCCTSARPPLRDWRARSSSACTPTRSVARWLPSTSSWRRPWRRRCRPRRREGLLRSAHDVEHGRTAGCLADQVAPGLGVAVDAPADVAPVQALFSESPGRVLVTVRPDNVDAVSQIAATHGVPAAAIGTVGGDRLTVRGLLDLPLASVTAAVFGAVPEALGLE